MTVNSQASTVTYQGNGVTTDWTFAFSVPADATNSIKVFVTNEDGIVRQLTPPEYTVVLNFPQGTNPTPTGGKVIYSVGGVPIPVGWSITIDRDLPAVQGTSITNQSIIYPPVIEQALDYLTMLTQKGGLDTDRSIKVPIGDPLPADLPPVDARKGQQAFFDANGNLTAGLPPAGGAVISAAMQPVVAAATIDDARVLLGLEPDPKVVTNAYVLTSDDNNRFISLEGNKFYLVTAADFSTYPTNFRVQIVNNDPRAKLANIFGYTEQFVIYPDQQVIINRGPAGWIITRPGRWRPLVPKQLYVDPNLGSDSISVTDGLAVGAGAFQTIAHARDILENNLDGDFTINLSNGTYNVTTPIQFTKRLPGGYGYKIVGNVATPTSVTIAVVNNIGLIVSDNAVLEVSGIYFVASGAAAYAMWALRGGVLNFGNVVFGPFASGAHVVAWSASVNITAGYHIAAGGSAVYHMGSLYNGVITIGRLTQPAFNITLDGGVTFSSGFWLAELNATVVAIVPPTYVNGGFASGTPQGTAVYNAVINPGAGSPGDLPANVSNGGFFF